MKKFYKQVTVREEQGGYAVCLDNRPVKTPAKKALALPNASLAEAVADEWRTEAEEIDPSLMTMTHLANSAVDRVSVHREAVIDEIAGFAETDLVCYRTSELPKLKNRQDRQWTPLLDWLKEAKEVELQVTESVLPISQNQADLEALRNAVASYDDYVLSALHMVTSACGSVVLGLATADGKIDGETAWELSLLEETFQINEWGRGPRSDQTPGEPACRYRIRSRFSRSFARRRMKSVRVRISGRVQGVWYRAWTVEQAGQRNLSGWCAQSAGRHCRSRILRHRRGYRGHVDRLRTGSAAGPCPERGIRALRCAGARVQQSPDGIEVVLRNTVSNDVFRTSSRSPMDAEMPRS